MALQLDRYPDIDYRSDVPEFADPDHVRLQRKWELALGYRIFARNRWGQTGDGHITARDPERSDHFWVLAYGVPFWAATIHDLVLVGPGGAIVEGREGSRVNTAGYNIHGPILAARPDLVSAAHTHTQFGTPWSANVKPFRAISQESCGFVYNQSLYLGEDLEVVSTDGGARIADAMGTTHLCILRNHGLLTGGASPGEAVGWFVLAERVAEVHVKAPEAVAISDDAAKEVAREYDAPGMGWRVFQWLARDLVPDPSVVL